MPSRLIIVPIPPVPPVVLNVTAVSATQVSLSVTYAPPPPAAAYVFFRAPTAVGPWQQIAIQSSRNYADTGVTTGVTYYYQAQVRVPDGRVSGFTAVVSATPVAGSNTITNGQAVTVTPPGGAVTTFGTRSNQAPLVWDHGQDGPGALSKLWGGGWPSAASNPLANMQNRQAPWQLLGSSTIQPPTPYTDTFLAANHYDVNVSNGGNAAMIWVPPYAPPAATWYSYFDGYGMHDANWWFCAGLSSYTFTATYVAGSPTFTLVGGIPAGFTVGDTNQLFSLSNTAFVSSQASPCNIVSINVAASTVTMNKPALVSGTFGLQSVVYGNRDENVKKFDYTANDNSPYGTLDWYTTNNPGGPKTNSQPDQYSLGQFDGVPANPDNNNHGSNWGASNNPTNPNKGWNGGWFKWAVAAKWSSGTDGFYKYWEIAPNGVSRLIINYAGPTLYTGTLTSWGEAVGGYARNQGAMGLNPFLSSPVQGAGVMGTYTQWRYFANGYYDRQITTLGRFYLTNSATFTIGDGNLAEIQPYIAWAPTGVKYTVNRGNLNSGVGNLWYVDEANGIPPTLCATYNLQ